VTGIAIDALHGEPLSKFSISERMSWSRGLESKCKEDKAYSPLAIFDISILDTDISAVKCAYADPNLPS
jgi:hypothetical protein